MTTQQLYYTPPTDEAFEEVKAHAINIWAGLGTEPSYSKEKIGRIREIKNIGDNFMFMVAMFDLNNQIILSQRLTDETKKLVRERMVDGGHPPEYIVF